VAGGALVVAGGAGVAAKPDDTGPILAFVGALIVAVLASWTARRNTQDQLTAEAARHRLSLASDRQLVDIQHLRELLDSAAGAYEEAHSACLSWSSILTVIDEQGEGITERRDAYSVARASGLKLATELHRIEMRFSPGHPVYDEFAAAREHLERRFDLLSEVWIADERLASRGPKWSEDVRIGMEAEMAFTRFASAVRSEIGTREAESS
jgi:hypothetical protein